MMKYLLIFVVSVFAFSCEKSEVMAAPKNKPANLVAELKSLSLPAGSKIIEESDGGGRMIGYYQWYIEIPNNFSKPKGKEYFFNKISSQETVLRMVNVSKYLDLDDSEISAYWSAVWTPKVSKYSYTLSVISTQEQKSFLRVQRYLKN